MNNVCVCVFVLQEEFSIKLYEELERRELEEQERKTLIALQEEEDERRIQEEKEHARQGQYQTQLTLTKAVFAFVDNINSHLVKMSRSYCDFCTICELLVQREKICIMSSYSV